MVQFLGAKIQRTVRIEVTHPKAKIAAWKSPREPPGTLILSYKRKEKPASTMSSFLVLFYIYVKFMCFQFKLVRKVVISVVS